MADLAEKTNDPTVIIKLLRMIASGTDAKAVKHDIILNVAADLIESLEGQRIARSEVLKSEYVAGVAALRKSSMP